MLPCTYFCSNIFRTSSRCLNNKHMSVSVKAVCFVGMEVKLHRLLLASCMNSSRITSVGKRVFSSFCSLTSRFGGNQTLILFSGPTAAHRLKQAVPLGNRKVGLLSRSYGDDGSKSTCCQRPVLLRGQSAGLRKEILLQGGAAWPEKKKTELCQELQLQARDLRFQHSTSLTTRNNCIIIRMAKTCWVS
ncbi:hypothetical protein ATANTOWER_007902 [Ataeniobius toweri]|uniref:Uncharacterized protein n=1 Tax=Ataeniobius toweri TaxID=208326 RepID=A0ABU7AF15_9TELE|nr:hypothetical protein [Ataeniobius toweri]